MCFFATEPSKLLKLDTDTDELVESFSSLPAIISVTIAASSIDLVNGPIWSKEEA